MTFVQKLFKAPTTPGILLFFAALLAVFMENSLMRPLYDSLLDSTVKIQMGTFVLDKPLLLWINDGLMAIFFLLIGLEVKREFLQGHLSSFDKLTLPTIAAFGGLFVPAAIYAFFNWGNTETLQGWAIPAATDIAFALGVLMLLGDRVPLTLKVILVAIAIIDDIAAIIIIALFYTSELSIFSLILAILAVAGLFTLNRMKVTRLLPYMLIGLFLWVCVLKSGVHATLAGVILGIMIPIKGKTDENKSPLLSLEHTLHPWVAFLILPAFAFANAGISFSGMIFNDLFNPITLGIITGFFVGKQVGVMGATWLTVKLKWCKLPQDINWRQYYGMALLTGIGFTMSLFIGGLSFESTEHTTSVRLGVLLGSVLSGILGYLILLKSSRRKK